MVSIPNECICQTNCRLPMAVVASQPTNLPYPSYADLLTIVTYVFAGVLKLTPSNSRLNIGMLLPKSLFPGAPDGFLEAFTCECFKLSRGTHTLCR